MKIGHGGYRRAPWWCWGVAILAAAAASPGAAIYTSAGEGPKDADSASAPGPSPGPTPHTDPSPAGGASAIGEPVAGSGQKRPPQPLVAYYLADVLAKIREESGLSESEAKEFLTASAKESLLAATPPFYRHMVANRVEWLGGQMVVEATDAGQRQIVEMFDAVRKFGTGEFAVEVRFVSSPPEIYRQVLPDSTMTPLAVDEPAEGPYLTSPNAVRPAGFIPPLGIHEGTRVARAELLVEKDSPVRFRVVDKEEGAKLIDRLSDSRANVLQAPKTTVFGGQTAMVSDTTASAFVVGVLPRVGQPEAQNPQICVVTSGTTLQVRPVADRSGAVHLDFAIRLSQIQDVETATFSGTPGGPTTIQIPKVASFRIEGGAVLKPGQWLLLGGLKGEDQTAKDKAKPVSWKERLLGGGKPPTQSEINEPILMLRAERVAPQEKRSGLAAGDVPRVQ